MHEYVDRLTWALRGQYKMEINVDDSNLSSSNLIQGAPTISGVPMFRTFSTGGTLVLRDG